MGKFSPEGSLRTLDPDMSIFVIFEHKSVGGGEVRGSLAIRRGIRLRHCFVANRKTYSPLSLSRAFSTCISHASPSHFRLW